MPYQLEMDQKVLSGSVALPASKSISNRLLILNSMASQAGKLANLSDSDDTRVLQKAITSKESSIDIGHAGTAMRFLTAFLSIQEGSFELTGSQRMKQRPIGKLVDALQSLGARIEYLENPGFPPLRIYGNVLHGGEISVDSSISSQFISALMMIGSAFENGLIIHLENAIVSSSYIRLTEKLMLDLGIPVRFSGKRIEVPHCQFKGRDISIEADWSAASYWYALAVLSGEVELEIKGLKEGSYQGDSLLPELFRPFGLDTVFNTKGIVLRKIPGTLRRFEYDFSDNPDLVQTMVVLCSMLGLPFHMSGTRTLRIKETDRIRALQIEIGKLGINLEADSGGEWISWGGKKPIRIQGAKRIKTYDDHRMAMAFSIAAMRHPGLIIENPGVVHKSYPGFWRDLKTVGFRISEIPF